MYFVYKMFTIIAWVGFLLYLVKTGCKLFSRYYPVDSIDLYHLERKGDRSGAYYNGGIETLVEFSKWASGGSRIFNAGDLKRIMKQGEGI